MIFAHDTELSLAAAAALVNTLEGDQDALPDLRALDEFLEEWVWTGDRDHDDAELRAVRQLRPQILRIPPKSISRHATTSRSPAITGNARWPASGFTRARIATSQTAADAAASGVRAPLAMLTPERLNEPLDG